MEDGLEQTVTEANTEAIAVDQGGESDSTGCSEQSR